MKVYDFGLNWSGTLKEDFVSFIQKECKQNGLSFIWISQDKVRKIEKELATDKLKIKFLLDTEATYNKKKCLYARICYRVKDKKGIVINDPDRTKIAIDKSVMHYELMDSNISVPFSLIIRNWFSFNYKLTPWQRRRLGKPFIIKPALGYGQLGLVREAKGSIQEIAEARCFDKEDNFLLQKKINPVKKGKRRAWFRVFNLFNTIIPCWWDDCTNVYEYVLSEEFSRYELYSLAKIVSQIAQISRMNWFSTEIAIDEKGEFIAIDYLNDQCGMSSKRESPSGVPEDIVKYTAKKMVSTAVKYLNKVEFDKKYVILLKDVAIGAQELGLAPGVLKN